MSLQKFCRTPVAKISADVNIVDACRMLEERNVGVCLLWKAMKNYVASSPTGILLSK